MASSEALDRHDQAMRALHDRGYRVVLPAATRAMHAYAAALSRRLGQSAWGLGRPVRERSLVAAGPVAASPGSGFGEGDAEQLMSILGPAGTEWPQILSNTLMPALSGWLGQIPLAGEDPAVVTAGAAWRAEWLAERGQVLLGVPDEVAGELRTELTRLAALRGSDVRDAKAAAQSMLDRGYPTWTNRAQLIARTEVVSANNQGMLASWRALAGTLGPGGSVNKTWVGGTRPTHSAVSGTTIGIDDKFEVGGTEMNGPGDGAGGAAEVCNCVVGDTLVQLPGLRAVMRRWYVGDVVTIRRAGRDDLTVTPNHPVLRADGQWIAAGLLKQGDYLIGSTAGWRPAGAPDIDGRPAKISEVYDAARLVTDPQRVGLGPPDFHGDGGHGEVEVVPVNRGLPVRDEVASEQEVIHLGFALADLAAAPFGDHEAGPGTVADSAGIGSQRPAAGRTGGSGKLAALLRGQCPVPVHGGSTTPARLNSGGEQTPPDGASGHAERLAQRLLRLPAEVTADEVVGVNLTSFSGHVYNLDTGDGWYTSNSTITRNCKCSLAFEVVDTGAGAGGPGLGLAEDEEGDAELAGPAGSDAEAAPAAEEPAGAGPGSIDYGAASDEDLSGLLTDAAGSGDDEAMNRILAELDRRDAAHVAEDTDGMSAEERQQDAAYNRLISQGRNPEEAFREVYGGAKETSRTADVIAQLRSLGYQGKNFDQLTRAVFKEEAERMYWLAEQETKGYLLNGAGKAAKIDPHSLFTGPESRARKYASDELLAFWHQYTRVTVEDIRAGILGGTMRSAGTAAWA